MSPDEAVRVVSDHLQENAGDTAMVAHKLVASARDAGSSDNITVIAVFLRDPRGPPPAGAEEGEDEGAAEAEAEEEPAAQAEEEPDKEDEEEEEDEEEAAARAERGGEGGSAADNGGKSRGGWPLQQCSAPADLGYEDRTDSFTDRTSLSLMGPPALGGGGGGIPSLRRWRFLEKRPLSSRSRLTLTDLPLGPRTASPFGRVPGPSRRSADLRWRRRFAEPLGSMPLHAVRKPGAAAPRLPRAASAI